MPASLWSDSGTWIALGISALFVVVALVMHRVIVKVLKAPPPDVPAGLASDRHPSPSSVAAHAAQPPFESKTP